MRLHALLLEQLGDYIAQLEALARFGDQHHDRARRELLHRRLLGGDQLRMSSEDEPKRRTRVQRQS